MAEAEAQKGEIVIYKSPDGPEVKVTLEGETLWLTQSQIAEVFGVGVPAINKHAKNIYTEAELSQKGTISKMEIVQTEGKRVVKRSVDRYNLDMIIAIGYRVNSRRATQFRIWATQRLRDYILKGFALNERRLKETQALKLKELEGAVKLLQGAIESTRLKGYEGDLLKIITDYTKTWIVLNQYDRGELEIENVSSRRRIEVLAYDEVIADIQRFKARLLAQKQAGDVFGVESGEKFKAILGSVAQSFGGKDVYESVEEKAVHLLYLTIKDHPFVDGNKRIGSLLFLLFLIENSAFYNTRGERKIADNTLAALALLVAESKPEQKEVMIKLIVNLINKK